MNRQRKVALGFVASAVAYTALRGRVRRYEIVERSMQPALSPGDFVIALPADQLSRGQIAVFDHPGVDNFELVKRVIGLPGEHVAVGSGRVHVDGRILAEPWADGPTFPEGEWQLGSDQFFLLGDNRAVSSADSRTLGPIARTSVRWRVVARYWPPSTMGRTR